MKAPVHVVLSLVTCVLMACGVETEPVSSASEPTAVSAAAPAPVCGDGVCCRETKQSCPQDCTLGTKPTCYITPAASIEPAPESVSAPAPVTAQACTTLRRPRHSSYWESFPIQPDGEVGGCDTADDCTVTCWGQQTKNVIHSGMFNCTYCR